MIIIPIIYICLQHLKPKDVDFKPRRTKAKGKGGTAKVIKTKKILKALNRRVSFFFLSICITSIKSYPFQETVNVLRQANVQADTKKIEEPRKDYGVLNRFLVKSRKNSTR